MNKDKLEYSSLKDLTELLEGLHITIAHIEIQNSYAVIYIQNHVATNANISIKAYIGK